VAAGSVSMVLFRDTTFNLEDVHDALLDNDFSILRQEDMLAVWLEGGPMLFVTLVTGDVVPEEAIDTAQDTPHAIELSQCGSRIDIIFDDLEEVRRDVDTLVEVQTILQDVTQGFVFNTWNCKLAPPPSLGQ